MVGRILVLVALGVSVFSACGGEAFDSAGTGGQSSTCGAGQLLCSDQCVRSDLPAFGCGNPSCAPCEIPHATAKCEALACMVETCQSGYADCNPVDPGCETNVTAPENCGACGVQCASGQVCDTNACASACSGGKENCNGTCADLVTDTQHCGSCDKACSQVPNSLPLCANSKCILACTSGFLDCNGLRPDGCEVNPKVDTQNCGACGTKCAGGEICADGNCELSCGGGSTKCGAQCVDTNTDEANCGDCGKACAPGQNCVAGVCDLVCGGGTTKCNGACVQLNIDPNNCGSCGNACGPTANCEDSDCVPKCTVPQPTLVLNEPFSNNNKGWSLEGSWQIGNAQISSGHFVGNADPNFDASGTTNGGVAGAKLGGNVPTALTDYVYLTSPVINTAGMTSLYLEYERWLNSDFTPWMQNSVEVFNGSIWVTIWQSEASPGIADQIWVSQGFDISAHANAGMRVRFGYTIGQLGVFVVSGWNVDNVVITTLACNS